MANFVTITVDTTAPSGVTIDLGGSTTGVQILTATLGCSDGDKTGYQMKIWGDVDGVYDANVQPLEGNSVWIAWATSKQIKLSAGDGSKTVYLKVRDDVLNPSSQASDVISLDTSAPVVTVSGLTLSKMSSQATKDSTAFSFTADGVFEEYKIKVVPTSGSLHDAGVLIGTANGSVNMAGAAGGYPASTPINCTLKNADLLAASAGDGAKIVKVFVRDSTNNWSV